MKDKTAFITGAAKGIGRATAVALSASGCQVILTDIDQSALDHTKNEIEKSKHESNILRTSTKHQK